MNLKHSFLTAKIHLGYFLLLLIFAACNNTEQNKKNVTTDSLPASISIKYAQGFKVKYFSEYKQITVLNPWEGAKNIQYSYYLIPKQAKIPSNLKKENIIRTPVQRVVCLSTTHIALIDYINETEAICGISGAKYVYNNVLREKIAKGIIPDVGYDQSLDIERLISLKPDMIMVYGIGNESAGYIGKLKEFGLPVVFNAEYLENTALGKAEWVKFASTFFNQEKLAEEKFQQTEKEYNDLCKLTKNIKHKPKILVGTPFNGVWYVPGGKSYFAKMLQDAGAQYIWAENDSRESIPFNLEEVFVKGKNADFWINTSNASKKADLTNIDARMSKFEAWNKDKIFNNNLRTIQGENSDYWESGIVCPEIVLKDLIRIFHPEILPEHKLYYYQMLK